jgi:non-heme chloroperoxidase
VNDANNGFGPRRFRAATPGRSGWAPSSDGVEIYYETTGDGGVPILFLPGANVTHLCWDRQFEQNAIPGAYLIRCDLRSHGLSSVPADMGTYHESGSWAEDVQSALDAADVDGVVICAWSYAGLVVCDYVRMYGTARVRGIVFVDAVTSLGSPAADGWDGTEDVFGETVTALAADLGHGGADEYLRGKAGLVNSLTFKPLTFREYQLALGGSLTVPQSHLGRMLGRVVNNDDVLGRLDVPVLVIHGVEDQMVRMASSRHIADIVPDCELRLMTGCAHAPFLDDPEAFNRALGAFARDVANDPTRSHRS